MSSEDNVRCGSAISMTTPASLLGSTSELSPLGSMEFILALTGLNLASTLLTILDIDLGMTLFFASFFLLLASHP